MCHVFITPFEFQQFLATSPQVWGIIDPGRWRNAPIRGVVYRRENQWYRVIEIFVNVDPRAQTLVWRTLTYLALVSSIHRDYTQNRSTLSYAIKNLDVWSRRQIATNRYHQLGLSPTFQNSWVKRDLNGSAYPTSWVETSSFRPTIHSLMSDFVFLLVHAILRGWIQPIRSTHRRTYSFYDSCYLNPIRKEVSQLGQEFNLALA